MVAVGLLYGGFIAVAAGLWVWGFVREDWEGIMGSLGWRSWKRGGGKGRGKGEGRVQGNRGFTFGREDLNEILAVMPERGDVRRNTATGRREGSSVFVDEGDGSSQTQGDEHGNYIYDVPSQWLASGSGATRKRECGIKVA